MPDTTRVIKTLVIGLGSTGTRVCDEVARRIQWELGDLEKAPWVRFLSIETDATMDSQLHQTGDFKDLTISAGAFDQILDYTEAFDDKIRLRQWIDKDTLRKLPGKEVTAGAGNIRMVGRLAFLYEDNYNNIKSAVVDRLDALRHLTENHATEIRGLLPDGTNPPLEFADAGRVHVIVAGTLCGGTGSGIVSDFGFFLKSICTQQEKVTGFFTLPRQDLVPAIEPKASCFKKNAYHALLELNHYHLAGREHENPIRFPDGEIDTGVFPYDLPYLAMPKKIGPDGEKELNRALGDRVFLSIFSPQTDPQATAVNATILDLSRRAHVFCAFGLSTVEFPVQQVMEACSKRLLAHALTEWWSRPLPSAEESTRLNQLGLTWDALLTSLRQLPGGESLQQRVSQKKSEVVRLARSSVDQAQEALEQLRQAYSQSYAGEGTSSLPPGVVAHTFHSNRRAAAEGVVDRVRKQVEARLLDYHDGPGPLKQLLQRALERIAELGGAAPGSHAAAVETVDGLFKPLRVYQRSYLLRFVHLKKPAIDRIIPKLDEALEQELRARENAEAYRALQNCRVRNTMERGVLDWVSYLIKPIQSRVNRLSDRTVALIKVLNQRATELARTTPQINGICIFEPETSSGGTVQTEYERCLQEEGGDAARDWKEVREKVAAEILTAWEALPAAIVPPTTVAVQDDWILRDFDPLQATNLIPWKDQEALERAARQPFLRLTFVDVLERWKSRAGADGVPALEAREAAQKAKPFLEVSRALAERGGRSPIVVEKIILAPESPHREEFLRAARAGFTGSVKEATSPDRFRAILLEEWYRFPLSGCPSVLGPQGLHSATCEDFPIFHTRKDVHWTGLSEAEVNALREGEELATLGILLGILEPKGGVLELPWERSGPGDPGVRRLPLTFRGAAQYLAWERQDQDGRPLRGARQLVRQSIQQKRRALPGSPRERDRAFVDFLDARLAQGSSVRGWDSREAAENITRFCANDPELYDAYIDAYPPPKPVIESLWRQEGETKPNGGVFEKTGLYCSKPECCGLFGYTEREAAQNGWRCYVNPEHIAFDR